MNFTPTETVLQDVAATISVTFRDQYGEPVAAGGTVTVNIATVSGTTVATDRVTSAGATGVYTASLTATETGSLDLLVCSWEDAGTVRAVTYVEIVGGVYLAASELVAREPSLQNMSAADRRRYIREAVEECERITGVSFVPRYRYAEVQVDSSGDVMLDTPYPRAVRTLTAAGTTVDVTDAVLKDTGRVCGLGVTLGYGAEAICGWEHGLDQPPEPIRAMVARRARARWHLTKSPEFDRQARFVMENGQTIGLASAGAWRTGDDEVDSVYQRWSMRVPGLA
jgi:hypothetical protein